MFATIAYLYTTATLGASLGGWQLGATALIDVVAINALRKVTIIYIGAKYDAHVEDGSIDISLGTDDDDPESDTDTNTIDHHTRGD